MNDHQEEQLPIEDVIDTANTPTTTNKLQHARRIRLLKQEMADPDMASIIRQQLRDNITPDGWHDGLFDMPEEPLPDIFYIRPSDHRAVIWWDYAFIGKQHVDYSYRRQDVPDEWQCEKDARRLRNQ